MTLRAFLCIHYCMNTNPLLPAEYTHGTVVFRNTPDNIPGSADDAISLGMQNQCYAWPGISHTNGGEILVCASERILPVDPYGRMVILRSEDLGDTWADPAVVFDSCLDERQGNLCTMADGTVVLSWYTSCENLWSEFTGNEKIDGAWREKAIEIGEGTRNALTRGWLRRSHDGGKTWEPEVYPTLVYGHAGPSPTFDGSLFYIGKMKPKDGSFVMTVTRSTDGGVTWYIMGTVPCPRFVPNTGDKPRPYLAECHVVEASPGILVAAFRADENGDFRIHLSRSVDNGFTWSKAKPLSTQGYPPHLLKLQTGELLLSYGHSAGDSPVNSIRAIESRDNGKTWEEEHPIVIRELSFSDYFGYPVSIEIERGKILTVYSTENSGILCTHWSVPGT